jgi:SNF2 family DNA or RNA helicase
MAPSDVTHSTVKLKPHQELETLYPFKFKRSMLLLDEMGLGKTITIIHHALLTSTTKGHHRFLCLVPKSSLRHWKLEWLKINPFLNVVVWDERFNLSNLSERPDVLILTYDRAIRPKAMKFLCSIPWKDAIILDEVHKLTNPSTKCFKTLIPFISQKFSRVFGITGTPCQNKPSVDMATLFGVVGVPKPYCDNNWWVANKKNKDEIKHAMDTYTLRRTKKSINIDIPDIRVMKHLMVEPTNSQKRFVKEIKRRGQLLTKQSNKSTAAIHMLALITKWRQVESCIEVFKGYDESKKTLKERINNCPKIKMVLHLVRKTTLPIVIFGTFVKILSKVQEFIKLVFQEHCIMFHGSMNSKQRNEAISTFQSHLLSPSGLLKGTPRIMLVSAKAGGQAITLTAAKHLLILESWFNPQLENQCIARGHRIGQKKELYLYRTVSTGIDLFIRSIMKHKMEEANNIVDGDSRTSILMRDYADLVTNKVFHKKLSFSEMSSLFFAGEELVPPIRIVEKKPSPVRPRTLPMKKQASKIQPRPRTLPMKQEFKKPPSVRPRTLPMRQEFKKPPSVRPRTLPAKRKKSMSPFQRKKRRTLIDLTTM